MRAKIGAVLFVTALLTADSERLIVPALLLITGVVLLIDAIREGDIDG